MVTLTCGLGAVAGSGMGGTDLFTRVSFEQKPALYWPLLLKQSNVKWLAHTFKLTRTAAGMLSLKMKLNHCLFCCSVAGTEYRHWWFLQPTTEQFTCLSPSDVIAKHCYLTAGQAELHLGDGCPPLLSPRRGGRHVEVVWRQEVKKLKAGPLTRCFRHMLFLQERVASVDTNFELFNFKDLIYAQENM